MSNKLLYLLIFLSFVGLSAQANLEFRGVKTKFDTHRNLLNKEFDKILKETKDPIRKSAVESQKILFQKKLDSIENTAFLATLVKVKTSEDLSKIIPKENGINNAMLANVKKTGEKSAEYPGGFNQLRQQVSEILYTENIIAESSNILKTQVVFIVERDGSISSVKAEGDNDTFNRQAIIAMYLIRDKFSPAFINDVPVRSHYKMPLTLNFK